MCHSSRGFASGILKNSQKIHKWERVRGSAVVGGRALNVRRVGGCARVKGVGNVARGKGQGIGGKDRGRAARWTGSPATFPENCPPLARVARLPLVFGVRWQGCKSAARSPASNAIFFPLITFNVWGVFTPAERTAKAPTPESPHPTLANFFPKSLSPPRNLSRKTIELLRRIRMEKNVFYIN